MHAHTYTHTHTTQKYTHAHTHILTFGDKLYIITGTDIHRRIQSYIHTSYTLHTYTLSPTWQTLLMNTSDMP